MRSYWDEDLAILSAENVSFSIETAGIGSRFSALALDSFFQGLALLLLTLAAAGIENYVISFSVMPKFLASTLLALYMIILFVLFLGYYFIFEWLWEGQTPGKRHFGLRVIQTDGSPITLWGSMVRNAVRLVDFMPLCYGFAAVAVISNPLSQRLGDLVAGTIVVREDKLQKERKPLTINEAVEAFLNTATTIPGTKPEAQPFVENEELKVELKENVDVEAMGLSRKLSREDYELVRDFLVRRDALPKIARERLGQSLVTRVAAKLEQEAPLPQDNEGYLEEVLSVLRRAYA